MDNLGQTILSVTEIFPGLARYFGKCNAIRITCAFDKIGQVFVKGYLWVNPYGSSLVFLRNI